MRIRGRMVLAAAVALGMAGTTGVALAVDGATGPVHESNGGAWAAGVAPVAEEAPAATRTGTGGRAAAPAAPRPAPVVTRPATQVAQAAPASVSYLSERYRVAPGEAARRLALQELSAPLADILAARFPGSYAGMWLDQAGGGVLTIAATDPAPVTEAVAGLPDARHVTVVPVRHSRRDLDAAASRVAGSLGVTAGQDVLVDERANEVLVLTGDTVPADDARLAGVLGAGGVPVRAQSRLDGSSIPKACDPRYCAEAPMRGGIRLDVPRDDGTVGGCTTGFNVRAKSGQYYVLTAGHCVVGGRHQRVDDTWHQFLGPKVPVGLESTAPVLAENAFPYDYAVLPYAKGATTRWAYPRRGVGNTPSLVNYWCVADNPACASKGSRDVPVTGVTSYGAVQAGWVVCATGSAYTPKAGEQYVDSGAGAGFLPGTRCGEVIGKASGGIDVRVCARPGDSGGPLFTESDGRALGILSNGDDGEGPCTNPDEKNTYAPVSVILDRVNGRTGLDFQIATKGPLLASPAASANR
ncbi:trypsin-like peptidase domain-containing protein [Micromonospora sp. NBC_00421]|uniref:trypsin-like peptidase domain-containing protein n=1 Tax=Micromonospora sp. NBC_00421 TaxID=2975976 RepID=UPI002E1DAB34